jgi:hypothetical protein
MDYEDGKETIAGFNELLGSVVELIVCAQGIISSMHKKIKGSTLEKDIFVFSFLRRMEDVAASVVIVSKGKPIEIDHSVFGSTEDRFADAALLARSALEGMWGFQEYKKDSARIAERWRLYTIYENYRRQLRIEKINAAADAAAAAHQWLIDNGYSVQDINKAEASFDFSNSRQNWYDHEGIPELANSFCDELIRSAKRYNALDSKRRSELSKGCRKLHAIAYGDFSRIAHSNGHGSDYSCLRRLINR